MENIFGRFSAALIDMDGVLYDSMPGHTLAWKKMMDSVGVDCSRDEFYLYEGMTGLATINLLMRRQFGHEVSPERAAEMYAVKSRLFRESGPAPLMPGADRMLAALTRGGLRCVLVTGSGQSSLLDALDRDYPGVFAPGCRVTAHDVKRGKPDPEPYLMGARKAGVAPSSAIVIENAPLGVRAGKAAGAFTIAVTTGPIPREEFEKEGADMIFDSMPRFADWLESRLEEYERERRAGIHPEAHGSVVYTDEPAAVIASAVSELNPDAVFVITDSVVARLCGSESLVPGARVFVMPPGETAKSLDTAVDIWNFLKDGGASRRSLVVNVGGGTVSDAGGFAASVFKRGLRFLNVPTTILAAADAAIGGKTAIDFGGLKNEIGSFAWPERVVISARFFDTLPRSERLSGLAEVVKTALLTDSSLYAEIVDGDCMTDPALMARAVRHAAAAKQKIVSLDARESGLRRILNLGHTAGHAFEMLAASSGHPLTHGEAVAHGILVALRLGERLAHTVPGLAATYSRRVLDRYYSPLPLTAGDIDALLGLMAHDKKNRVPGVLSFVLLKEPGCPEEAVPVSTPQVRAVLETLLPHPSGNGAGGKKMG